MSADADGPADRERRRRHAAFLEAVNLGDTPRVQEMLSRGGIDLNYVEPNTGYTVLHIAAGRNAAAVLRVLIATGKCDPGIKDAKGRTAAHVAATIGRNPAVARFLSDLQHGAGVAVQQSRDTGRADQEQSGLD